VQNKAILVYMTAKNLTEAEKIAEMLVEKRLASGVNLLDKMKSVYWWKGKIERNSEVVVLAQTRENLFKELEKEVKLIHSYKCPCILSMPISDGNFDFFSWIDEETKN
jgi:periplasmic divalent cation tolerance protein